MTQDNLTVEKIKNRTEIENGVYELDDGAITTDDISIIAFLLKQVESQKELWKTSVDERIAIATRCAEIAEAKLIERHMVEQLLLDATKVKKVNPERLGFLTDLIHEAIIATGIDKGKAIRTEFQLSKEG